MSENLNGPEDNTDRLVYLSLTTQLMPCADIVESNNKNVDIALIQDSAQLSNIDIHVWQLDR